MACGGVAEGVRLYDIRIRGSGRPQLELPCAISRESKLAWNPFIPYWIAASTEAGLSIYDLRYTGGAPLRTLAGTHLSDVSSTPLMGTL